MRFCWRPYEKSDKSFVCRHERLLRKGNGTVRTLQAGRDPGLSAYYTTSRPSLALKHLNFSSRRKGGGQQRFTTNVRVVWVPRSCWYLKFVFVQTYYPKIMFLAATTARTFLVLRGFVGPNTHCLGRSSCSLRRRFEHWVCRGSKPLQCSIKLASSEALQFC